MKSLHWVVTCGLLSWVACGESDTNTGQTTNGGSKPSGGASTGGKAISGGVPGTGGVVATPTGGAVDPAGGRADAGTANSPSGAPNMGGGGADGTGGMPGPGGGASPGEGGGGSASGGIGNCASATDAEQCSERGCFPVTMTPRLRLGGMGGEGGFGFASDCTEEAQEEEFIGCANGEGGGPGDVCFCRKGNWRECAFGGPEVPWVTDDWISASCDYVGCTRFQ